MVSTNFLITENTSLVVIRNWMFIPSGPFVRAGHINYYYSQHIIAWRWLADKHETVNNMSLVSMISRWRIGRAHSFIWTCLKANYTTTQNLPVTAQYLLLHIQRVGLEVHVHWDACMWLDTLFLVLYIASTNGSYKSLTAVVDEQSHH